MLWFNFILGSNFIFFYFKCIIILLPYLKTKEHKILTKDEIEPQHLPIHMEDFHT